jgi:hypothetical protein
MWGGENAMRFNEEVVGVLKRSWQLGENQVAFGACPQAWRKLQPQNQESLKMSIFCI